MCETASFCPNIRLTCKNVETAMALVNKGLGITFAPEILSKEYSKYTDVSFFRIRQFQDTRKLYLVYHKNRYLSLPLSKLFSLLHEIVPTLYFVE